MQVKINASLENKKVVSVLLTLKRFFNKRERDDDCILSSAWGSGANRSRSTAAFLQLIRENLE